MCGEGKGALCPRRRTAVSILCRGPGVTSFQQMPEIKRKAPARRARKAPPAAAAAQPAYAGDAALERLLARAGKSAGIRIGALAPCATC